MATIIISPVNAAMGTKHGSLAHAGVLLYGYSLSDRHRLEKRQASDKKRQASDWKAPGIGF